MTLSRWKYELQDIFNRQNLEMNVLGEPAPERVEEYLRIRNKYSEEILSLTLIYRMENPSQ